MLATIGDIWPIAAGQVLRVDQGKADVLGELTSSRNGGNFGAASEGAEELNQDTKYIQTTLAKAEKDTNLKQRKRPKCR
jgi:hypothetical protein